MSKYASKIAAIVESIEGNFLVKGGKISYSEEDTADLDIVVAFSDVGTVHTFLTSDAYKEISTGRIGNTTGPFMVVEGV